MLIAFFAFIFSLIKCFFFLVLNTTSFVVSVCYFPVSLHDGLQLTVILVTHSYCCVIIGPRSKFFMPILAYGTRARSARGSQNCAILSIICPFTGNSAFWLCVNDVVLGVPCRKDATEVFFCEVHTNKYIINTVLPSS